jgi:K+-sensing histidine kinase KdpD
MAIVAAAVVPIGLFGILLILTGAIREEDREFGARILLFAVAVTVVVGVVVGYALSLSLTEPLRDIAAAVRRVSDGDLSQPIPVSGSDVLAQLAESHNRLVADAERRNRQLGSILAAVERASPEDGAEALANRATRDAEEIFELIAGAITFTDPAEVPVVDRVPGDPLTVRADMRVGDQPIGVLIGRLPATRTWERADQALFELYASEIAAAVRNAQLFAQVEDQNAQLRRLDEAKDDFLRGVSHNLQTPLTRIKANAEGLSLTVDDPRLGSITDQADRLSRMVAQLLLVGRLGSGQLRPDADVLTIAARVRRAWDALSATGRELRLDDASGGWLAVGDGDQFDQVLWALLDNAVKYGVGAVEVAVGVDAEDRQVWTTITSDGPGLTEADREWLFERFARGETGRATGDGSGLGLYVSRALMRGMDGDLSLDPPEAGRGARFRLTLPGEPPPTEAGDP